MKVALYARYSTALQDKTSIDGQVANCEALAGREGLEIVSQFRDEGRSGNDDQRDGYQAMLAGLKRGDFIGIVCDETSRITRNQAELHRLTAELRFRDQFLITCDGIDTRSESSDLVLSVKAAIDQMEGRKIGYRTYRGLRERHKAGHSTGGRIYGYSSEQNGDYKRRIIDPEQAKYVREIFKRYAAGESGKTITRNLNERGVPSPGSFWNHRQRRCLGWVHTTLLGSYVTASGILRNPIYTGRATWNKRKGKKVPGTSQRIQKRRPDSEWMEYRDESLRIISDEVWELVQARLLQTRHKTHTTNKGGRPARYLLSGLLICASCGGHYVMRNGRVYCCSSHTNGRDSLCSQRRTLKRETVESNMLEGIKREYLAPSVLKELSKQVQAALRQMKRPDTRRLKANISQLDAQITNVVETLTAVGQSDALTAKLLQLEQDKAELLVRLASEKRPPAIVPNVSKLVRERIETLERLPESPYADAAVMDKARSALRDLLGEVTVVEESDGVFARVDMGRACITSGAEERT